MFRMITTASAVLLLTANTSFAQTVDCSLPENAASAACTGLDDNTQITNLAFIGTGIALVGLIAVLSGGDDSSSTPSTN